MCSFFKGKTEKKIGCKTVLCLWMQLTNNTYMQRMYHASAHSTDRYKFAYMAQHDVEMSRHIQTGRQKVKQIQWNRNKKKICFTSNTKPTQGLCLHDWRKKHLLACFESVLTISTSFQWNLQSSKSANTARSWKMTSFGKN